MKYMGTYEELQHSDEIQHIMKTIAKTAIEEDENNKALDDVIDEDGGKELRKTFLSEAGTNITEDENEEITNVPFSLYSQFLFHDKNWIIYFTLIPIFIVYAYTAIYTTFYYGKWIKTSLNDKKEFWKAFTLSIIHPLGHAVLIFIIVMLIIWSTLRKTKKLHEGMFWKIINAPINLYFDKTPSGKILNRFSNDIDQIDSRLPR